MAAAARTAPATIPAGESVVTTESMLPFEEEQAVNDQDIELPPGKKRFTPEELYRFTRIKPFVLRFWESEFPALKPKKDEAGGMAYDRADVELILAIKKILYEEGLTLAEARRRLSGDGAPVEDAPGGAKTGNASAAARKKPPTAQKNAASKKPARKGAASGKKKAASTGKAATAKKPGKPTAPESPGAAGKTPGKGRRGLPAEDDSRSRVSLEELLPDTSKTPASKAPAKPPASRATQPRAEVRPGEKTSPELARALAGAVRELREILTLLRKGDR